MMSKLNLTDSAKQSLIEKNMSAISLAVALDISSTAIANVAGNNIADTIAGSPVIGDTLDNLIAARLVLALQLEKSNSNSQIVESRFY